MYSFIQMSDPQLGFGETGGFADEGSEMRFVRLFVFREAHITVYPVSHVFQLLSSYLRVYLPKPLCQVHGERVESVVGFDISVFIGIESFPVVVKAQVIQKIQNTLHHNNIFYQSFTSDINPVC